MDKSLQIAGWSAVSFFVGMGTQLTGVPNFIVGIAFYALGGIGFVILVFSHLRGRFAILTSAIGSALTGAVYFLMVLYAIISSEKPPEPEVTARFVGRSPTGIILINKSDASAEGIKWSPLLFNVDEAIRAANDSRQVFIQPLAVPAQSVDFIRPHQESLSMDIFQQRLGGLNVREGDRITGSVSISCAKCARGHTFIIFIVSGKTGWYWEQKDNLTGLGVQPANGYPEGIINFYLQLEASIPQDYRTTIYER
jgi:hypothetical protein